MTRAPELTSAGWQVNGDASWLTSSTVRLVPNSGSKAGSLVSLSAVQIDGLTITATIAASGMTADGFFIGFLDPAEPVSSVGSSGSALGRPVKAWGVSFDSFTSDEIYASSEYSASAATPATVQTDATWTLAFTRSSGGTIAADVSRDGVPVGTFTCPTTASFSTGRVILTAGTGGSWGACDVTALTASSVPTDFLRVEIGLGYTPDSALSGILWHDATSDVLLREGVSFNRGRDSQDDAPSPGRLTFTLHNGQAAGKNVGRWTRYGSNALSGWELRVPVRVRHTTHGVLWVGYVDALESGWENGVLPVVRVSASDRLAQFARIGLASAGIAEMETDDPYLLFPLNEPTGTTCSDRRGTGASLRVLPWGNAGRAEVGAGTAPDASPAPDFQPADITADFSYLAGTFAPGTSGTGAFTYECLVSFASKDTSYFLASKDAGNEACDLRLGWNSAGYWTATHLSPTGNSIALTYTDDVTPGEWYHVAVTGSYSAGSYTLKLYIDGAEVATGTDTGTLIAPGGLQVGAWVWATYNGWGGFAGQVSAVALYDTALAAARLTEHMQAFGLAAEDPATRWERLCALGGLAAADYATTGAATYPAAQMLRQETYGADLLTMLNECAAVEQGVSFLDRTGKMRFHRRDVRLAASPGLTLGPNDLDRDVVIVDDTDRMANGVTVTRVGGGTQRVTTASGVAYSRAAFGRQDASLTLACATDEEALNIAEWRLGSSCVPYPRIDSVAVDVVSKAATVNVANALTADVSTMIRLSSMPTPSAPSATVDLFVEGIADAIDETRWVRTYATSNATPESSVIQLDGGSLGYLDSGRVLG